MWRVILISIIINATRPRVLSTGSVRISMRRSSEQNRFRWKLFFFIIISLLSHTTWKFMPKRPDGARKKKKNAAAEGGKKCFRYRCPGQRDLLSRWPARGGATIDRKWHASNTNPVRTPGGGGELPNETRQPTRVLLCRVWPREISAYLNYDRKT